MAWAFRKRIKFIPGVYINLSKSGIRANTSIRGGSLTFRSDGVYENPRKGVVDSVSRCASGQLQVHRSAPLRTGLDAWLPC